MRPRIDWNAAALAVVVAACAGGTTAPPLPPLPDRATRATLSGPLCASESCSCKAADDAPGRADPGAKRFEVRLGPAEHELWATIDGMVLFKGRERATDCFYVDLRPGVHQVAIRGAHDGGVGFRAAISEGGGDAARAWWYDTFAFACGSPGPCDRSALRDLEAEVAGKRGKLDPCGSTKVKKIRWHSGQLLHGGLPDDLQVSLELQVYDFAPGHPPGAAACTETREP